MNSAHKKELHFHCWSAHTRDSTHTWQFYSFSVLPTHTWWENSSFLAQQATWGSTMHLFKTSETEDYTLRQCSERLRFLQTFKPKTQTWTSGVFLRKLSFLITDSYAMYTSCKFSEHWLLFVSLSGQSNLLLDNITTFPVTLKCDVKLKGTLKGTRLSCLIKSIQKNSQFLSCDFCIKEIVSELTLLKMREGKAA